MSDKPNFKDALSKITKELSEMPPEELTAQLDSREVGDVGQFVLDMTDADQPDKPLVGPGSYQSDSTNTEKLLTEKPREIALLDGSIIEMVEKSAYDALKAERDELIIKCNRWKEIAQESGHAECWDTADELRAEVERRLKEYANEWDRRTRAENKLKEEEAENARLRAALEFYAKGYHIEYVTTKDGIKAKANTDNGEIARAALKGEGE